VVANCAATEELPSPLWNMIVQYCIQESSPLVPILNQINPVHTTPSFLTKNILILFTHLCLVVPSGLFPSSFPTSNLYAFLFGLIHPTCPADLILLGFIVLIILSKEYSFLSFSFCSFYHPPVISCLFRPNILSTLFSSTLSLCLSVKFLTRTEPQANL
jgi:hypothetical protein